MPGRRRFTPTHVGKTPDNGRRWPRRRFTPTHVGKTRASRDHSGYRYGSPPRTWGRPGPAASGKHRLYGSPPRTWGRLHEPLTGHVGGRFTPTHVGKTAWAFVAARRRSVHPHARGEDSCQQSFWTRHARFTPTPVGKTFSSDAGGTAKAVHPHARGEDVPDRSEDRRRTGSPPRPWGRLQQPPLRIPALRFTPTPVGKTASPGRRGSTAPVHPHARGEDQRHVQGGVGPVRFTPTPVGKTTGSMTGGAASTVHPHARGEDFVVVIVGCVIGGSPPRPWGRLDRPTCRVPRIRFTPTPVGKTGVVLRTSPRKTVHPHARGEDVFGTGCSLEQFRFTPTPVGKTTSPSGA